MRLGSALSRRRAAVDALVRRADAAIKKLDGGKPMLQQYFHTKLAYPDFAVLMRVGDFYEVFGQPDVDVVAEAAELAVAMRGDAPMCGMPIDHAQPFLAKLAQNKVRVLMVEQSAEPLRSKTGKLLNVFKRIVSQGHTPGSLVEEALGVNHDVNNFLLSIAGGESAFGLARYDLSTNELQLESVPAKGGCLEQFREHLAGLSNIREVVVHESLAGRLEDAGLLDECSTSRHKTLVPEIRCAALDALVTVRSDDSFAQTNARFLPEEIAGRLKAVGVEASEPSAAEFDKALDAARPETELERRALLGLTKYLAYLQPGYVMRPDVKVRKAPSLCHDHRAAEPLKLHPTALRNLELTNTIEGKAEGSLLSCIKRTKTSAGSRALTARTLEPLQNLRLIKQRHDSVEALGLLNPGTDLLTAIRRGLAKDRDISKIVQRVVRGKSRGVDMARLLTSLRVARKVASDVRATIIEADDEVQSLALGSELGAACSYLLGTLDQVEADLNLVRNAYMFADVDGLVRDLPASVPRLQAGADDNDDDDEEVMVVVAKATELNECTPLDLDKVRDSVSSKDLQRARVALCASLKDALGLTADVEIYAPGGQEAFVEVSEADAPKLLEVGFEKASSAKNANRFRHPVLVSAPENTAGKALDGEGGESAAGKAARKGGRVKVDPRALSKELYAAQVVLCATLKDVLGLAEQPEVYAPRGRVSYVEVAEADTPKLIGAGFKETQVQPASTKKRLYHPLLAPRRGNGAGTAAGEVRNGFCPELDRLRDSLDPEKLQDAREALCTKLKDDLGLLEEVKVCAPRGKISYVEVTVADAPKLLEAGLVEATKQSTKNKRRFHHPDLVQSDKTTAKSQDRIAELEGMILAHARSAVEAAHDELKQVAHALAVIDVSQSNATVADEHAWCRPAMVEDPRLLVEAGEHPVLKDLMGPDGTKQTITHNSLDLQAGTKNSCWVITGPNMGGKSTFLRQNALIVILAQMGSFVPAASAVVGVADQLFCRVGAEDHLTQGRSTFQVEMEEVSHIIKHATERSLVVVDEVGRGTSNADGESLAQAVLEDLVHRVGARTLFATHFHEVAKELAAHTRPMYLHAIVQDANGAQLPPTAVWAPGRVLTHSYRVLEGISAGSCGLFVADTAGVSRPVVERAAELLSQRRQQHQIERQRQPEPEPQQM